MKTGKRLLVAMVGVLVIAHAAEVLAAGPGGGGKGRGKGNCTAQQGGTASAGRPIGSQRRDGSFMTTGTTANGSTVRPGRGNGNQDGSRVSNSTPVVTEQAQ